jgi:hypothetical protein
MKIWCLNELKFCERLFSPPLQFWNYHWHEWTIEEFGIFLFVMDFSYFKNNGE